MVPTTAMQEANNGQCLLQKRQQYAPQNDTFRAVAQWMRKHGASVEMHLQNTHREHGGTKIRGVISTKNLKPEMLLMRVPKKFWIWEHSHVFVDLKNAKHILSKHSRCRSLSSEQISLLTLAVSMAREKAKGKASVLYVALKSFPSFRDYHSFHPRLAEPEILHDYKSLGISHTIKLQQKTDRKLKLCFDAFQHQIPSLADVTWRDVHEASMQIRTRGFTGPEQLGEPSLVIPLADLLNTAPDSNLNTEWQVNADAFTMKVAGSVAAHVELFDSYCEDCNNKNMLNLWGIYLEDNVNRGLSCSKHQASDRALHAATMMALQSEKQPMWTAPRCKADIFTAKQGPLRCSLARLAWEACSIHWVAQAGFIFRNVTSTSGGHSQREQLNTTLRLRRGKFALHSKSLRARAAWEAALLDRSRRHRVHPALLRGPARI
eukprot:gnl/MRDRNA2_/MRDRNA2_86546_c0_seq1.p1 gnl/MRDRNA2_/MRDRNA2_86546_c0~~gnl/MRDRNA2_/MRDRNA2_86546_c0_seq1.p1  ORF type:complete len:479 (+),score=70.08 gnl/MRDRNA2_/MRDRNA2_86546_c0_seq1:139-1437(+)